MRAAGDCAVKLGFGFTLPDTYICTQRGDEVAPDDGCTLGCEGVPMQAIEADVDGFDYQLDRHWPKTIIEAGETEYARIDNVDFTDALDDCCTTRSEHADARRGNKADSR